MTTHPRSPLTSLRVLCVDDNQDAANSLGQLLRMHGADVAVAHDGPSALAAARDFPPDVALLDISMPGMDGCELARRLRAGAGGRPLLLAAVTAQDGFRAFEQEASAGFDLHYTKPADPVEVVDAVLDYLRGGSPQPAAEPFPLS